MAPVPAITDRMSEIRPFFSLSLSLSFLWNRKIPAPSWHIGNGKQIDKKIVSWTPEKCPGVNQSRFDHLQNGQNARKMCSFHTRLNRSYLFQIEKITQLEIENFWNSFQPQLAIFFGKMLKIFVHFTLGSIDPIYFNSKK